VFSPFGQINDFMSSFWINNKKLGCEGVVRKGRSAFKLGDNHAKPKPATAAAGSRTGVSA